MKKDLIPEIHFTLRNLKTNEVQKFESVKDLNEFCLCEFDNKIGEAYQDALNDDGADKNKYTCPEEWFSNLTFKEMFDILWEFDYELTQVPQKIKNPNATPDCENEDCDGETCASCCDHEFDMSEGGYCINGCDSHYTD